MLWSKYVLVVGRHVIIKTLSPTLLPSPLLVNPPKHSISSKHGGKHAKWSSSKSKSNEDSVLRWEDVSVWGRNTRRLGTNETSWISSSNKNIDFQLDVPLFCWELTSGELLLGSLFRTREEQSGHPKFWNRAHGRSQGGGLRGLITPPADQNVHFFMPPIFLYLENPLFSTSC